LGLRFGFTFWVEVLSFDFGFGFRFRCLVKVLGHVTRTLD